MVIIIIITLIWFKHTEHDQIVSADEQDSDLMENIYVY